MIIHKKRLSTTFMWYWLCSFCCKGWHNFFKYLDQTLTCNHSNEAAEQYFQVIVNFHLAHLPRVALAFKSVINSLRVTIQMEVIE